MSKFRIRFITNTTSDSIKMVLSLDKKHTVQYDCRTLMKCVNFTAHYQSFIHSFIHSINQSINQSITKVKTTEGLLKHKL